MVLYQIALNKAIALRFLYLFSCHSQSREKNMTTFLPITARPLVSKPPTGHEISLCCPAWTSRFYPDYEDKRFLSRNILHFLLSVLCNEKPWECSTLGISISRMLSQLLALFLRAKPKLLSLCTIVKDCLVFKHCLPCFGIFLSRTFCHFSLYKSRKKKELIICFLQWKHSNS